MDLLGIERAAFLSLFLSPTLSPSTLCVISLSITDPLAILFLTIRGVRARINQLSTGNKNISLSSRREIASKKKNEVLQVLHNNNNY
jgi:hypothetical protein